MKIANPKKVMMLTIRQMSHSPGVWLGLMSSAT